MKHLISSTRLAAAKQEAHAEIAKAVSKFFRLNYLTTVPVLAYDDVTLESAKNQVILESWHCPMLIEVALTRTLKKNLNLLRQGYVLTEFIREHNVLAQRNALADLVNRRIKAEWWDFTKISESVSTNRETDTSCRIPALRRVRLNGVYELVATEKNLRVVENKLVIDLNLR